MMGNSCVSYVKQVGRQLRCSKAEKKRLLAGLETELADTFPESGSLSLAGISAQFGAPKDVAAELQAALPTEDTERYIKRREHIKRIVLVGLVLLLLATAVCGFVKWSKAQKIVNGDFRIVTHDPQEVTDKECYAIFEAADISISDEGE